MHLYAFLLPGTIYELMLISRSVRSISSSALSFLWYHGKDTGRIPRGSFRHVKWWAMDHESCTSYVVAEHKCVRQRSKKGALKAPIYKLCFWINTTEKWSATGDLYFSHSPSLDSTFSVFGILLKSFSLSVSNPDKRYCQTKLFFLAGKQTVKLRKFSLKVNEIIKDIWWYLEHQLFRNITTMVMCHFPCRHWGRL